MIVILGAFVGVVPLVLSETGEPTIPEIITGILGTLIVILKGVERIWLPEEKWQNYRKASESLKRERECYIEGVRPYSNTNDEDKNYMLYVNRCIQIKAEEQNNFWGLSGTTKQDSALNEENNKA